MQKITPFLWFDSEAEEAAGFYVGIFPDSKIIETARYAEGSPGVPGSVMTVVFELNGQPFIALNGGPVFRFTEAVSFSIDCENQDEVDYYWNRLSDGGEPGQCGWLKDRYGLSWQVNPRILAALLGDPDRKKSERVMQAMLKMGKIEIGELLAAAGS